MAILVTGGAGFIGCNFIIDWLRRNNELVINVDKLTYAANLNHLSSVAAYKNYQFVQADINQQSLVFELLNTHRIRAIVHFAAESHVDRSIVDPEAFLHTNVVGTFRLLETVKHYWTQLPLEEQAHFRFVHISTDEVFGSLDAMDAPFTEQSIIRPNSPYSASKAAADHFVRAYYHTYGLPVITTNCSNNYGPCQFPEKLIPLTIQRALAGQTIPIYGNGQQIRDWLYVVDHVTAIQLVLENGRLGEVYTVGGLNECTNLSVVTAVCAVLDSKRPRADGKCYAEQMTFVTDRPGHDQRYAINPQKIQQELGWQPRETFHSGLEKTVNWYLVHTDWAAVTEQTQAVGTLA